ncbi:MAG TPA: AraC family transcriptional regulator ligand-binding domain-containing protein, partial [Polyangiaceae bacterium]|nr:AraC family transcriptional regulator ligand-binding domain-containing protein [Polyangiaceae bacterium]
MPSRPTPPSPSRLIVRALLVELRDAGVDVQALAAEAGLEVGMLEGPLGAEQADAFLSRTAAALPPWFGLRIGAELQPELFGVVGLAAMASPTFRTALERLARYKRLMTGDDMILRSGQGETTVQFHAVGSALYVRQKVDCELAFVVSLGRRLTRSPIAPLRVAFEFSYLEYY